MVTPYDAVYAAIVRDAIDDEDFTERWRRRQEDRARLRTTRLINLASRDLCTHRVPREVELRGCEECRAAVRDALEREGARR